jgi:hypothetical protein
MLPTPSLSPGVENESAAKRLAAQHAVHKHDPLFPVDDAPMFVVSDEDQYGPRSTFSSTVSFPQETISAHSSVYNRRYQPTPTPEPQQRPAAKKSQQQAPKQYASIASATTTESPMPTRTAAPATDSGFTGSLQSMRISALKLAHNAQELKQKGQKLMSTQKPPAYPSSPSPSSWAWGSDGALSSSSSTEFVPHQLQSQNQTRKRSMDLDSEQRLSSHLTPQEPFVPESTFKRRKSSTPIPLQHQHQLQQEQPNSSLSSNMAALLGGPFGTVPEQSQQFHQSQSQPVETYSPFSHAPTSMPSGQNAHLAALQKPSSLVAPERNHRNRSLSGPPTFQVQPPLQKQSSQQPLPWGSSTSNSQACGIAPTSVGMENSTWPTMHSGSNFGNPAWMTAAPSRLNGPQASAMVSAPPLPVPEERRRRHSRQTSCSRSGITIDALASYINTLPGSTVLSNLMPTANVIGVMAASS